MQAIRRGSAEDLCGLIGRRSAAAFIALFALLGVGHVLPALHFSLVAHRICVEHGELLHQLRHEAGSAPAAESRSSELELVPGQHAGHEHEHCGVLALPGSAGLPPSASWRERPEDEASLPAGVGGERTAHGGIALLRYAPKLAPPG